jgi:hypothetical protein
MVFRSPRTAHRLPDAQGPLELRPALPADGAALRAVAHRDSRALPEGPLLLAEVAGIPIAAIATRTGETVADPFWPTTAAVAALRDAAGDVRPERPGLRRRRAVRGVLRRRLSH